MRHKFYFSDELHILGIIAILLYIILLFIIATMWIHIEQQDETIQKLRRKVIKMECNKAIDKVTICTMCLHKLFEKIDNLKR